MPTHLTEALRTNMSGGKTVAQLLAEAAATVPFMSLAELQDARRGRRGRPHRARRARARCLRGAATFPARGCCRAASWSCASTRTCPIPRGASSTCCEFGNISTLAAATLREMGFLHAVALDGGMKAWREAGYPLKAGREP